MRRMANTRKRKETIVTRRTSSARIADEDHLRLRTFHHFVFYAWSQVVLLLELAAFDCALVVGGVLPGRDVLIRNADFEWRTM